MFLVRKIFVDIIHLIQWKRPFCIVASHNLAFWGTVSQSDTSVTDLGLWTDLSTSDPSLSGPVSLLLLWTNRITQANSRKHQEFAGRLNSVNNKAELYQHLKEENGWADLIICVIYPVIAFCGKNWCLLTLFSFKDGWSREWKSH